MVNHAGWYWYALPSFHGHHLLWLHREKSTKKTSGGDLAASDHFHRLEPIGKLTISLALILLLFTGVTYFAIFSSCFLIYIYLGL